MLYHEIMELYTRVEVCVLATEDYPSLLNMQGVLLYCMVAHSVSVCSVLWPLAGCAECG